MKGQRLSIFPLPGAILFPGLQLPLHIFELRYRAMISQALARDRLIGMIQPRGQGERGDREAPLFDVGCIGKITDVEALADGCYNVIIEGQSLFRVIRELGVTTAFRQVEAETLPSMGDAALAAVERAALETESRRFATWLGYRVDWDGIAQLDDMTLVNAIAQIAPFDATAKQALLEAQSLSERAELEMQLMRFTTSRRDPDDNRVTLQ
jgi:Lon protease-like protein